MDQIKSLKQTEQIEVETLIKVKKAIQEIYHNHFSIASTVEGQTLEDLSKLITLEIQELGLRLT